jgi:hypothetical protein
MKSLRESTVEDLKNWNISDVFGGIEYFEEGCLCIIDGKLPVLMDVGAHTLLTHYLTGCVCSRHPEGEKK